MTTYSASAKDIKRDWYVVDATDKVLGRLATQIANHLRGKHKPEYTPNLDTGDYIVVVNAEKIRVTGNKQTDKIYYRHSGYPGGLKQISFDKLMQKAPEDAINKAVKGMLPRGPLGRAMFRKLKVYASSSRHLDHYGYRYLYQHRPTQKLRRPGFHQARHRQYHDQRSFAR